MSADGTLFVAYRFGIAIFNDSGKHLGTIDIPEAPANCTFVGKDRNILFVTAQKNVYKIRLPIAGISFPQEK